MARYFYPRSPCGERHPQKSNHPHRTDFYPRSPCGERLFLVAPGYKSFRFLSTLSLRRATNINSSVNTADQISIHALLAESDVSSMLYDTTSLIFLSTLSLRRATNSAYGALDGASISIHALLAESDLLVVLYRILRMLFLSTLSLRRATHGCYSLRYPAQFLSTLSLRRATSRKSPLMCSIRHFYPRSPCGERPG